MTIKFTQHTHLFAVAVALLTSCSSGTWEDDPDNWERIYNQEKPEQVNVIHSWYWKSAHWTHEYEFYIETDSNKQLLDSFLSNGDLTMIEDPGAEPAYNLFPHDKPKWFVPKPMSHYQVWKGTWNGETYSEYFTLFMDKDNGHLYWCDSQL